MSRKGRGEASSSAAGPADWEREAETWETYAEEMEGLGERDDESSGEDDETFWGSADPEEELLGFLLEGHRCGRFTARDLCTIGYWAAKSGVKTLEGIALRPGSSTGNYKRHIDSFLQKSGVSVPNGYTLPIPAFIRSAGERGTYDLTCIPPHEILIDEMKDHDLDALMRTWTEPHNWQSHPVVAKASSEGVRVLPCALYLDGVQLGKKGSLVVVTIRNLVTDSCHVVAAIRKRLLCGTRAGCGCRGWCSLLPLWVFLKWSFDALSSGIWPRQRHSSELDGEATKSGWRREDVEVGRQKRAGTRMPFRAACLQVRSDWGELAPRVGLSNWSTHSDPCFLCHATFADRFSVEKLSQRNPEGWKPRDPDSYETSCKQCEIEVQGHQLSEKAWVSLRDGLSMDVRYQGSRGLSLQRDFPSLHLRKGDRLDATPELMDWNSIYKSRPGKMVFWRCSAEGAVRHRNPLICKELGTTMDQIYVIDVMHCWALGIHQFFLGLAFWKILEGGVLAKNPSASKEARIAQGMKELNRRLTAWYVDFQARHPDVVLTRAHELTIETLGTKPGSAQLKLKAHETLGVLRFAAETFPKWSSQYENGKEWASGAKMLMRMWTILDSSDVFLNEEQEKANPIKLQIYVQLIEIVAMKVYMKFWAFRLIPFVWPIEGQLNEGNPSAQSSGLQRGSLTVFVVMAASDLEFQFRKKKKKTFSAVYFPLIV